MISGFSFLSLRRLDVARPPCSPPWQTLPAELPANLQTCRVSRSKSFGSLGAVEKRLIWRHYYTAWYHMKKLKVSWNYYSQLCIYIYTYIYNIYIHIYIYIYVCVCVENKILVPNHQAVIKWFCKPTPGLCSYPGTPLSWRPVPHDFIILLRCHVPELRKKKSKRADYTFTRISVYIYI